MGDQIRIPRVELTYFFLHSLSNAIFKTVELPALCDVVSSISQLFVPHFAMSPFMGILGFHVTSGKKMKIKILSFYLHQVKVIFKHISFGLSLA